MSQYIKSNKNESNKQKLTSSPVLSMQQQKSEKIQNQSQTQDGGLGIKDVQIDNQQQYVGVGSLNLNSTDFKIPANKPAKQKHNQSNVDTSKQSHPTGVQNNQVPPSPSKKKQKQVQQQNAQRSQGGGQQSSGLSPGKNQSSKTLNQSTAMVFGSWYEQPPQNKDATKGGKNSKQSKKQREVDKQAVQADIDQQQKKESGEPDTTNSQPPKEIVEVSNHTDNKDKHGGSADVIVEKNKELSSNIEADFGDKGGSKHRSMVNKKESPDSRPFEEHYDGYEGQRSNKDQNKGKNSSNNDFWSAKGENKEYYGEGQYNEYDRRSIPQPNRQGTGYGHNNQGRGNPKQSGPGGNNGSYGNQTDQYDDNQYYSHGYHQQYNKQGQQYYQSQDKKKFKPKSGTNHDHYEGDQYRPRPNDYYPQDKYFEQSDANYGSYYDEDQEQYYKQKDGINTSRVERSQENDMIQPNEANQSQKQSSWVAQPQIQHKKKKGKQAVVVVTTPPGETQKESNDKTDKIQSTLPASESSQQPTKWNDQNPKQYEETKERSTAQIIVNTSPNQPISETVLTQKKNPDTPMPQMAKEEKKEQQISPQTMSKKKKKQKNQQNVQQSEQLATSAPTDSKVETKGKDVVEEEKKEEVKGSKKTKGNKGNEKQDGNQETTTTNRLHVQRSKSQQQLPKIKRKNQQKEKEEEKQAQIQNEVTNEKSPVGSQRQGMGNEKKLHQLDPDKAKGKPILVVISIQTRERIVEATIREGTNINFLNDKISVLADFKNCPKKFKEIFQCYLKNQYTSALTQKVMIILGNNQNNGNDKLGLDYANHQNVNMNNAFGGTSSQQMLNSQSMMNQRGLLNDYSGLNSVGNMGNNMFHEANNNPYLQQQNQQHLIDRLQQSINAMPIYESPYEQGSVVPKFESSQNVTTMPPFPQQNMQINTENQKSKKKEQTKKKNQNSDQKNVKNDQRSPRKSLLQNKVPNNFGRRSGSMPCDGTKEMKKAQRSMNRSMMLNNKTAQLSSPKLENQNKLIDGRKKSTKSNQNNIGKQSKSDQIKDKNKKQKHSQNNDKQYNNFLDQTQDNNQWNSNIHLQNPVTSGIEFQQDNQKFCSNLTNNLFSPPKDSNNQIDDQTGAQQLDMRLDQANHQLQNVPGTSEALVGAGVVNPQSNSSQMGVQQKFNSQNLGTSKFNNSAAKTNASTLNNTQQQMINNNQVLQGHHQATQGNMNNRVKRNNNNQQMIPPYAQTPGFPQNFNINLPQIQQPQPFAQMQQRQMQGDFGQNNLNMSSLTDMNQNMPNYSIPHQKVVTQGGMNNYLPQGPNNSQLQHQQQVSDLTQIQKLENQIKNQIGSLMTTGQYPHDSMQKMNQMGQLNQISAQQISQLNSAGNMSLPSSQYQPQSDYNNQNTPYNSWPQPMMPNNLGQHPLPGSNQIPMYSQNPQGRDGQNPLNSLSLPQGNYPMGAMKAGGPAVGVQEQIQNQPFHKNSRWMNNNGVQAHQANTKPSKINNNGSNTKGANQSQKSNTNVSNAPTVDGSQQRQVQQLRDSPTSQADPYGQAHSNNPVIPKNVQNVQYEGGSQSGFGVSQGQNLDAIQSQHQQYMNHQQQQQIVQNLVFVFQMGNQQQHLQQQLGQMPGNIDQMVPNVPSNIIEEQRMDARSGMVPHQRNSQLQPSNLEMHSQENSMNQQPSAPRRQNLNQSTTMTNKQNSGQQNAGKNSKQMSQGMKNNQNN